VKDDVKGRHSLYPRRRTPDLQSTPDHNQERQSTSDDSVLFILPSYTGKKNGGNPSSEGMLCLRRDKQPCGNSKNKQPKRRLLRSRYNPQPQNNHPQQAQ